MSNGIQILPRIKHGTTYVPTVGHVTSPVREDNVEHEPQPTASPQPEHHESQQETPKQQDNTLLIVVFAIIIVALIVLILWLVARSDTGKRWLNNTAEDKRARLRELTKQEAMVPSGAPALRSEKVNHKSVIGNASEDELRKYANMPIQELGPIPVIKTTIFAAEVPIEKPKSSESRVQIVEESDDDKESDSDSESDSGKESDSDSDNGAPAPDSSIAAATNAADQAARDRENDDIIDQEFSKKLQQFSQEPTDSDITDIKKEMDKAIDNMGEQEVQENPFPIQQLNTKGEPTKLYADKDALIEDGYDYNAVLKCCNGTQKVHKGHKWKFSA